MLVFIRMDYEGYFCLLILYFQNFYIIVRAYLEYQVSVDKKKSSLLLWYIWVVL